MKTPAQLALVVLFTSAVANAQWASTTGTTGKCAALSMVSDTVGYAVIEPALPGAPRLVSTTDGATWNAVTSATYPGGTKELKFIDATTGFLVRGGSNELTAIWKTTDSGLTWTAKPITLSGGATGLGIGLRASRSPT